MTNRFDRKKLLAGVAAGSALSLATACAIAQEEGVSMEGDANQQTANSVDISHPGVPEGYELVWGDEFNGSGVPDPEKWVYDTHANKQGWYNEELQYYSASREKNARMEGGVLVIEAHHETLDPEEFSDWGGQEYTSARLMTDETQVWDHGYFEIRAKLPCAYGSWPAIWMLGTREGVGWPAIGEIDIMEHVGQDPGVVHASLHTRDYNHSINTQRTAKVEGIDTCDAFHDYQLLWTDEEIYVGLDGEWYFHAEDNGEGFGSWPFVDPEYLILNVAVGGWGGNPDEIDPSDFPQRMEVDYVRVYQPAE